MNKLLEYMAFGKAQVMFDLPEGRASAGGAAFYVTENSAERLGQAIDRLLNDSEARERMGQLGARRLHEHLGWERSVPNLLAAYEVALR